MPAPFAPFIDTPTIAIAVAIDGSARRPLATTLHAGPSDDIRAHFLGIVVVASPMADAGTTRVFSAGLSEGNRRRDQRCSKNRKCGANEKKSHR
jgi:hypothetical protein